MCFLATSGGQPDMSRSTADDDLQARLDRVARQGGGTLKLGPKAIVTLDRGIVIPERVALDLNGSALVFSLREGNDVGVRLRSHSSIRNGTVRVRSLGNPGIQTSIHAPILVGELYGAGGTPAAPSSFNEPADWTISGVTVSSDKSVRDDAGIFQGAAGIAVMAGAHKGIIENVTVPDSAVMAGGIHLDWGTVGDISSAKIPDSANLFRAGLGYTTHPHDIVIRNVRIGRLTRAARAGAGSFGIRLSGVDHVTIDNVEITEVTEAAFLSTAGDLGYEFARPADKKRAYRGIRVSNFLVHRAEGAYLLRTDSYADNVERAAAKGYKPMLPPIGFTDIAISNFSGRAGTKRAPAFGVRVDHQRGGLFTDVSAIGFRRGFYIDEQVYDLELVRPVAEGSVEAGISVEHPYRPPGNIVVVSPRLGPASTRGGDFIIGRSDGVSVRASTPLHVRVAAAARRVSLPPSAVVLRD